MKRIDAPAPRVLIDLDNEAKTTLTEAEAHMLERDVAKVGRAYGRAHARVRKLRAALKKALPSTTGNCGVNGDQAPRRRTGSSNQPR